MQNTAMAVVTVQYWNPYFRQNATILVFKDEINVHRFRPSKLQCLMLNSPSRFFLFETNNFLSAAEMIKFQLWRQCVVATVGSVVTTHSDTTL